MKVLVQRVSQASVTVAGEVVGRIGPGLVGLVGVAQGDTDEDARYLVDKTVNLRIFPDEAGKFNRSLADVGGGLLLVSQFTLISDTRKGRRPSFIDAAGPGEAEALFNRFVDLARATGHHRTDRPLPGAHAGGDTQRRPGDHPPGQPGKIGRCGGPLPASRQTKNPRPGSRPGILLNFREEGAYSGSGSTASPFPPSSSSSPSVSASRLSPRSLPQPRHPHRPHPRRHARTRPPARRQARCGPSVPRSWCPGPARHQLSA